MTGPGATEKLLRPIAAERLARHRLLVARLLTLAALLFSGAPAASAQCTGCGNASFAPASRVQGIGSAAAMAVADFNNDGIPDVATVGSDVSVYLGDGYGGFALGSTFHLLYPGNSIAVGDFNRDGKTDLAVAWPGGSIYVTDPGEIMVFLGDGGGGLSAPIHLLAGFHPASVVTADFNGDGNLDLVSGSWATSAISVLLGDGQGGFAPAISIATPTPPTRIAVGDINGDGMLDLAVAMADGSVHFLLASGGGMFRDASSAWFDQIPSQDLILADINGDGRLDAVVLTRYDKVALLLGHGDGAFDAPSFSTTVAAASNLVAADFNADGRLDLIVNDSLFLGDGFGNLFFASAFPGFIPSVAGDFDGDGLLDVASANNSGGITELIVSFGAGDGRFLAPPEFPMTVYPARAFSVDLNADGKPDLLIVDTSWNLTALLGNGTGDFGPPVKTTLSGSYDLVIGDFDEDGFPDVVIYGYEYPYGYYLSFLRGDGAGHFGPAVRMPAVGGYGLAAGDFNGDHHLDIALANFGPLTLFFGDGKGLFGPSRTSVSLPESGSLVATDLNKDGKLDLVLFGADDRRVLTLLGDGQGAFVTGVDLSDVLVTGFLIADFNGDGIPDLATIRPLSLSVRLGNGSGSFASPVDIPLSTFGGQIVGADFDGDGKLDLAVGGIILRGDGAGGFRTTTTSGYQLPGTLIAAADLTGDGKPDLVGYEDGRQALWLLPNTSCEPRRLLLSWPIASCGTAGNAFAIQPTVRVVDDGGNLVACDSGPVTASIVPGTGTSGARLDGMISVAASGGVASFGNLSIDLPGRGYELRFTHPRAHLATSRPFSQSMPAPTINGPAQTCTVGSSLFDGGAGYDSYVWTLDGVVAGSSRFVTIGPLATGPHALQLIVKQNGCQATGSLSLATQSSPPAPAASNNGPVSFGGILQLFATTVSGPSYSWTGPNGFSSTLQNPMIPNATPPSSGRYRVVARVGGCASAAATTDATVLPAPACGGCAHASFAGAARALPVADDLVAVVLEDFDQDGIPDIAIAHGGFTGEISLLRGNGRGGFAPAVVSRLPVGVRSLAAADLNGDGFPDVVGRVFNGVIVALASPSGAFGPTATYLTHSDVSDVAISDINGDGIPDLVVTNRASNTISVLLGSASGTFGSPVELAVGTSPSAVLVRDLNGDGNPDVVVANQGTNSVSFLLGDGNGGFGAPSSLPVPGSPFALAFGDVTGEGVPDLLVGLKSGSDQLLAIFQRQPGGAFTFVRAFPLSLTGPIVVADVDLDGRNDLLTLGADGFSIRMGRGGALFEPPATFFAGTNTFPGPMPVSLAVGDFSGDGLPDVVIGSGPDPTFGGFAVSSQVALLPGDGHGGFSRLPGLVAGGVQSEIGQLVVSDLDHDGHPDLLFSLGTYYPDRLSIFLSDGHGGFLPPTDIGPPNSFNLDSFVVGDVDGDGLTDLVELDHAGGHISVFPGIAAGGFSAPVVSHVGRSFSLRSSGDFNGDGRLDLLISDDLFITSPGLSVLLGNSAFRFGSPIAVSGFVQPAALAVADFNHDGRADIVVANAGSKSVSVYLGDGTGRFGLPLTTVLDTYPNRVVAADFNGDGNMDVVVGTGSNNIGSPQAGRLWFLSGNGAGEFAPLVAFGAVQSPASLLVADFNGDGKPDLAASLPTFGTAELFMGDGLGGFAAQAQYLAGGSVGSLAAGDINGDGRIDLVVPDSYPAAVHFLFNTNCIPSRLGVTSSPTCPPPGQTFPTQPVVKVFDDGDNVVACDGRAVTGGIVPGTGSPGAVLGGTTSVNAVNGVASFSNLSIDLAGTLYQLEFHHPLASPARTPPFSVGALPSAPAASNNGPICGGQTLQLSASSVPGAIYRWIGPNGFGSGLQNPSIAHATVLASGTYSVTVTVNGCTSSSATTMATVVSTPAPTASNNGPICAGQTLQLGASTVPGATYSWTGPSGFASAEQNPQILSAPASASGIYTVIATANGCSSPAATTSALVRLLPSATILAAAAVCPSSFRNTASVPSAGPGATYSWGISNGAITAGAGTPSIVFTAGTTGSVLLSVSVTDRNGCSASDSRSITINQGPDCQSGFLTVIACRAIDTRNPPGPLSGPALAGGSARAFRIINQCGIPNDAASVSVNVTITNPTAEGHLTFWPNGTSPPLVSTINFRAGQTRANNAILSLGAAGDFIVSCAGSGTVDFILDVNGYFR